MEGIERRFFMNQAKIIGIETANPPLKMTQQQIWKNIQARRKLSDIEKVYYKRFFNDPNINTKYIGIENLDNIFDETPDQLIKRFEKYGILIGTESVKKCLQRYKITAEEVDAVFVTTCTGYLCPGLTSYVSQHAGFREDIYALDLVGMGCGAAIPAIINANEYLKNHPNSNVIVLCVEICTAAISWGDEIDLVLSNVLFGDGAAACLLSNKKHLEGLLIKNFHSILWPQHRNELRFKHKDSRLCNVIKKDVPGIASKAVKETMKRLSGSCAKGIHHYAVHPGGRRILDEIEQALDFKNGELLPSREILRNYGNMSSPSVLFVLKRILESGNLKNMQNIALFAFGAGFTAFGLILQCFSNKDEFLKLDLSKIEGSDKHETQCCDKL
jgi:alkylresorcinol/alkylpyrone synthase